MAAIPISNEIKLSINADWRTGQYSQRQLADKYNVSTGLVANLTKGIDQDTKSIVSAGVEYLQGLQVHDERIVSAVQEVVDQKVKWLDYLNNASLKNVKESMQAPCYDQQDYRSRAQTIGIAKEVLVGKNPAVAVQVNNQVNSSVNSEMSPNEFEEIALKLLNR